MPGSSSPASASAPGRPTLAAPAAWQAVRREGVLVALAILAYFAIRNTTGGSAEAAFENAERLVRWEDAVSIDVERPLQDAIDGSNALVTLANWVYIWGHWPVILASVTALFVLRRGRYYLLRNALFVSGAIGFAFFALFPVAPPRLLDLGLVDTVTEHSHAYRALQPPGLTNPYAAFPSLHAGWNLLVGIVLFQSFSSAWVRLFALVSPLAMAVAVVATANHFVVDPIAGAAVVLVGLLVARRLESRAAPLIDPPRRYP